MIILSPIILKRNTIGLPMNTRLGACHTHQNHLHVASLFILLRAKN